ncbi:MAG: hypothetical protein QOE08_1668 [Thermoleophilaceae bacterium]|nr:hypothetical protein [Thermoleophilaceae bacterium]
MDTTLLARELTDRLGLTRPPVGLAFVAEPPAGVERLTDATPSACALWTRAEEGPFYASAEQHMNCPIGATTMGFELPQATQDTLMGLVEQMCAERYIGPDEPPALPSVGRASSGIVYGPLSELPLEPDVLLVWLSPAQAMIYNEAAGSAAWTSDGPAVYGRPTCAALPAAMAEGRPVMSLGCIGMRTFTQTPPDLMLGVIPAAEAPAFLEAIDTAVRANEAMRPFYEGQRARFATAG